MDALEDKLGQISYQRCAGTLVRINLITEFCSGLEAIIVSHSCDPLCADSVVMVQIGVTYSVLFTFYKSSTANCLLVVLNDNSLAKVCKKFPMFTNIFLIYSFTLSLGSNEYEETQKKQNQWR